MGESESLGVDTSEIVRIVLNETSAFFFANYSALFNDTAQKHQLTTSTHLVIEVDMSSLSGFSDKIANLYTQLRIAPKSIQSSLDFGHQITPSWKENRLAGDTIDVIPVVDHNYNSGSKTFITEVNSENSKLSTADSPVRAIDLVLYPGFFTSEITPLPNGVQVASVIKSVICTRKLSLGFKRRLVQRVKSEEITALVSDLFWWFYINHWQADKQQTNANSEALFSRIAESYVVIFLHTPDRDRDEFVKIIPDILAQTIYQTMCVAYPINIKPFESEKFKSFLSDTLSQWIAGIRMQEKSWERWSSASPALPVFRTTTILETTNTPVPLRDTGRKNSISSGLHLDDNTQSEQKSPSVTDDPFDLTTLMSVTIKPESPTKTQTLSHYIGPLPPTSRAPFDIYGNSPIIQHYFSVVRNSATDRKTSYIRFTHVERESEQQTSRPTYRELILESTRKSRKTSKKLSQYQETINKERFKLVTDALARQRSEAKEQTRLLSRPREIRKAVDELMERHKKKYGELDAKKSHEVSLGHPCNDLKTNL